MNALESHRLLLLGPLYASLSIAAASASASPIAGAPPRVSEPRVVSLALSPSSTSMRGDAPLTIHDEGATFVKVHFSLFDLPEGVRVEVANADGSEVYRYAAGAKDDFTEDAALDEDGRTRFASMSITGETATLRLVGVPHHGWGAQKGIRIKHYDRGLPRRTGEQDPTAGQPSAVCGQKDSRAVACYEADTEAFVRARAVARLMVGGHAHCTAWRVGSGNRMLTNHHCLATDEAVRNAELWFNYQADTCTGDRPGAVVKVSGATLLRAERALDYALITVNNAASISSFGHLSLDVQPVPAQQNIYIAGHPDGRLKELSITSDADGGPCRLGSVGGDSHSYTCDTEPGSSGSPVLARGSGKVIGLHYASAGQCGNSGKRMELIWPRISSFFDNSVP